MIKSLSIKHLFYLTFVISIIACSSSPKNELRKKINLALRNDNAVDEVEWGAMTMLIQEHAENFPEFIGENNEIKSHELLNTINKQAEKRRNKSNPKIFNPENQKLKKEIETIKVFIENSGSMDGYVRNTTEFEAALSDLLVQIQFHYLSNKLDVHFINTKMHPSEVKEVNTFVEQLEPGKAPYKVGERGTSKLNEIFKMILETTGENQISILISDCIYSLEKGKDTHGSLEFQKSLTKGVFLQKFHQFDYTTMVKKMNSKFTGYYYDFHNGATWLVNENRPYYMWMIGASEHMDEFVEKINLNQLKGSESSYNLSVAAHESHDRYYTVLRQTNKKGWFKPTKRGERQITSISDIEFEQGVFQFAVAVDLHDLLVDKSYVLNTSNYLVSEGFTITSIEEVNQQTLESRDYKAITETPISHVITVIISENYALNELELTLKNKIPKWVENSSVDNDVAIKNQSHQTFGLSYVVKGVSEAYAMKNKGVLGYVTFKIELKK